MRVKSSVTLLLLAALCAAPLAVPAGASVPGGNNEPWDSNDGPRPTAVTGTVECVIVEVREERTLIVRDEHDREHEIQLPEKAKIKAANKREFDGRKKLRFVQLRPGHELKITYLTANGEIVRVKVTGTDAAVAAAA